MKEREGKSNGDCKSQSPMPSTSAEPSSSPWGLVRLMGVSKAGGGRRGWWGQGRPMGAVSHWPHARACQHQTLGKLPGQIPSQHSPFGPKFSRRNESKEMSKNLRSSSKFQIPLNPYPKTIQTYSVIPNTQSSTKQIQIPTCDPIRVQSPLQICPAYSPTSLGSEHHRYGDLE
jgi:hypothetical protein